VDYPHRSRGRQVPGSNQAQSELRGCARCARGGAQFQGRSEEGVASAEKGIRLSPSDPRLFIWLSGLAAAHYQLRHYTEAVETGRRSWTINRSYITGLTCVVAGLAQLGKIEDARAALANLQELDPKLAALRATVKLYQSQAGIDHLLEGLHKAGFE